MPCDTVGKPVRVTSWLMDSGTSLDLINAKAVTRANERYVYDCEPILLDTANGETNATKAIDLHVGALDANIAPVILPNTVN